MERHYGLAGLALGGVAAFAGTAVAAEITAATFATGAAITATAATAIAAVSALAAFATLEAAFTTLAAFARTALAAEFSAAKITGAALAASASTATMPAVAFAALARAARLAGPAGWGFDGLAAEEALQPTEETARFLCDRLGRGSNRTIGTDFALRTNFALRTGFAFRTTALLETPGTIAFATAISTIAAETFATALAALKASFTALASLKTAFTAFAALVAALPALLGGLARGGRQDVDLGFFRRSCGSRRGYRSYGYGAHDPSRSSGRGRIRLGGCIGHGSFGWCRSGYLSLGSRGRRGLGDGSGRRGGRLGDGSGSRSSGFGLGRGGTKTAGSTGQRDHRDRRGPVGRFGGGLRRGSGDGLAFAAP